MGALIAAIGPIPDSFDRFFTYFTMFFLTPIFSSCLCRDQNFGINELSAIQDIRNEFNLQDITDEPPSSIQPAQPSGSNDRGKWFAIRRFFCHNFAFTTEKYEY